MKSTLMAAAITVLLAGLITALMLFVSAPQQPASPRRADKALDTAVFVDLKSIDNQCGAGVQSVMLNNRSTRNYKITVLKRQRGEEDTTTTYVKSRDWAWIGCNDDGYSYAIIDMVKE